MRLARGLASTIVLGVQYRSFLHASLEYAIILLPLVFVYLLAQLGSQRVYEPGSGLIVSC